MEQAARKAGIHRAPLDRWENGRGGDPFFELTSLQLEADAWPLALRSDAGKQMLIAVYVHHAQNLSSRNRLAEANAIAESAGTDDQQAHDWLQCALREIDVYHLEFKRPLAENLATQIVSPSREDSNREDSNREDSNREDSNREGSNREDSNREGSR